MGSSVKRVGWTVVGVAAVALVFARVAFAEPPSHGFNSPPQIPERQHAHKPHAPHKPHPASAPVRNLHKPHVIVNRPPQAPLPPITHIHKQVSVVRIVRQPHVNKGPHTINIVQVPHQKTFKVH